MGQLVGTCNSAFVFTYAKSRFSHGTPHSYPFSKLKPLSHCHELGYDLLRVMNSPHLVENSPYVVGCRTQLSAYRHNSQLVAEHLREF